MAIPPDFITRNRFLLTNLAIILVFILTLVVLLFAYPVLLAPEPSSTSTPRFSATITPTRTRTPTITLTPTATRTRRPTNTPTITLTPTRTHTPGPTQELLGPPTLIPATPVTGNNIYSLQPWSAEKADRLIEYMAAYPNTLSRQQRGDQDQLYYSAFQYAVFALREALLRYPDAEQAVRWQWNLAYNYARLNDERAGTTYENLITEALNRGLTNPEQLSNWFEQMEPRLKLYVTPIDPLSGTLEAYLIAVRGFGESHSLVIRTTGSYQIYSLASDLGPSNPGRYMTFSGDLTGDAEPEIIISQTNLSNELVLTPPRIYSFVDHEITLLDVNPMDAAIPLGVEFINHWKIDTFGGTPLLVFEDLLFPSCPVQVTVRYKWDGDQFNLKDANYELQSLPGTLAYCQFVMDIASQVWGSEATIQVMESVLPQWPPLNGIDGQPFPTEIASELADEWRFQLGIQYALLWNRQTALKYLEPLAANPSIPTSRWAPFARQFLEVYKTPADLYRACLTTTFCDATRALEKTVEQFTNGSKGEILPQLWETGVTPRTTGYFDFDGDQKSETWFSVRHRSGEKLEFWIIFTYQAGLKAITIGQIDANLPLIEYVDDSLIPPIIRVNHDLVIQVLRSTVTLEPFIGYLTIDEDLEENFLVGLDAAEEALLSGADPGTIRKDLINIVPDPEKYCLTRFICDPYYYLLGLTYELDGQRITAVETYLHLWGYYSRSPYTTMARLKLRGGEIVPTLTPTSLFSPTPTGLAPVTPTPGGATMTPTPVGFLTPTPTVAGTATLTPTATEETPYPEPATSTPRTQATYTPYP